MHRGGRISDSSFPPADRIRPTSPRTCQILNLIENLVVLKLRLTILRVSARLIRFIIEFILSCSKRLEKKYLFFITKITLLNNFHPLVYKIN